MNAPSVNIGGIIASKYKVGQKIGSGSFGQIHLGTNTHTNEEVAIKFESIRTRHPQLFYESKIYQTLSGGLGIPNMH